MRHYTYKLTLPETGEYYIGVRSCKGEPLKDKYKGSMNTWKVNKLDLVKEIYCEFNSRDEANEWEQLAIFSCIDDKLNRNYHIPNVGFCMFGKIHSDETKAKIKKSCEGINLGNKHSDETKSKMSEIAKLRVGDKHPRFGTKHSDETKAKMSKPKSEEHKRKLSEAATLRHKKNREEK
jgi:hypothetical protein